MGLVGATGVGVGAIVGGGILALTGVAFATTGPSAMLAFALNGVIALLTALTFAELATRFPESGGTYAFAKKVLSVEAAFSVGWVAWFASIVAAVLYAFGFGAFMIIGFDELGPALGITLSGWMTDRILVAVLASGATVVCTINVVRTVSGGGQLANVGKLVMFGILVAAGLWALVGTPARTIQAHMTPFFADGTLGLFRAMGYTFIALQGFDLIATVSGEIRDPQRTIPRAMLLSLGIALAIYIPLLLIITSVGVGPGQSIVALSTAHPEAVVAIAARRFLGSFGYWLVVVAAILSMLSALQANILAASRIGRAMARDRALPRWLDGLHPRRGTPVTAALCTAAVVIAILIVVPDVAAIGAASSLVFLVTFVLAHGICVTARRRGGADQAGFRTPWFPAIPIAGALSCAALAIFQGINVPHAGLIAMMWLALGGLLYLGLFARRARTVDAYSEALDAELVRLRGRSPLVLVPVANPANAEALVGIASALAPPKVGRVLLLSIVPRPEKWSADETPQPLIDSQTVLRTALAASISRDLTPESMTTIAAQPWLEIQRVARIHRCQSLVLGLSSLSEPGLERRLETLIGGVGCDVVVLRAPQDWLLRDVRRVLVPIAGRGDHGHLRARLLASMHRLEGRAITLLSLLPPSASARAIRQAERELQRMARDEVPGQATLIVRRSNAIPDDICRAAAEHDLVIMGVRRLGRKKRAFGELSLRIARETSCGIVMVSRRG